MCESNAGMKKYNQYIFYAKRYKKQKIKPGENLNNLEIAKLNKAFIVCLFPSANAEAGELCQGYKFHRQPQNDLKMFAMYIFHRGIAGIEATVHIITDIS